LDVLGVLFSLAYLVFSLVGALIVSRRRENSVGWLFCAIGFVNALWVFTRCYAIRTVAGETNWLPAGHAAAWLANVLPVPGVWLLLPVLFLFPTGRPLSARWRRLIWLGGLTMGAGMLAAAFEPGPVAQIEVGVDNPLGIASLRGPLGALDHLLGNFGVLQTLLAAAGVACLIVRFRHGESQERLQLKWFAYASGFALLMMVVLAAHSIYSGYLVFANGTRREKVRRGSVRWRNASPRCASLCPACGRWGRSSSSVWASFTAASACAAAFS
jgi:hypothetical protein